jgi:NAD(P)-dependent dehydrogenase (short-subunit alcohol dehydrogenase family)
LSFESTYQLLDLELFMDLVIRGKRALLFSGEPDIANACRIALLSEGVELLSGDKGAKAFEVDIVVALAPTLPKLDLSALRADILADGWDYIPKIVEIYQSTLPGMKARKWGRFIFVGSNAAKEICDTVDYLNTAVNLSALGLQKLLAGEVGDHGITCNSVLWDADAILGSHRDLVLEGIGAAVAFLASGGAAYLTGITVNIDRGQSRGAF